MSEAKFTVNELAEQRNEMGFGRTVMALERTLMAWIRTSLSLISFGFTIFKFIQMMQEGGKSALQGNAARNLGLYLVCLGMGLLILAVFQFRRGMAIVMTFSERKPMVSLSMVGAIGVLLTGLFAILNILFGVGGI